MTSKWKSFRICDSGRIVTGKTPKGGISDYEGAEVPFISPPDFIGQKWIKKTVRRISEAGAQSIKRSLIPSHSILVTCIGSDMGKAAITTTRCVTNQQINAVIVDETKFSPEFLYYNLSLRKEEIRGLAGGSAQPILNKSAFGMLNFEAPDLDEQKEISAILRPIDDQIILLREVNTTLESIAQAIFKSWFVDFDPVHAKMKGLIPEDIDTATADLFPDSFEESKLGDIPKGWKTLPIGSACKLGRGASPRPIQSFMGGDVPWIKIADATASDGLFIFETKEKVTKEGALKSVLVAPGDLIMSNSASCGIPSFVEIYGCIHDGWLYFSKFEKISKSLLFFWLRHISNHLIQIADGSVQKNLNISLVSAQHIIEPTQEVLINFDELIQPLLNKIRDNCLQMKTLSELRDAMLPRLMSGQLYIPEVDTLI